MRMVSYAVVPCVNWERCRTAFQCGGSYSVSGICWAEWNGSGREWQLAAAARLDVDRYLRHFRTAVLASDFVDENTCRGGVE